MQSAAHLFLVILPYLVSASGQLVQICNVEEFVPDPNDPPLPDIPNQFVATIEGNLVSRSQSFVVKEYYDQVGDRGRIEVDASGTKSTGIFDYNIREIIILTNRNEGDCTVYEISPTSRFFFTRFFGFSEVNGTIHIGSPAAFLEMIRENSSAIYHGTDMIRGIPVHHWQSCYSVPNNSYIINYYFASQSNWTFGEQLNMSVMIPVEFNLNASFVTPFGTIDNAYNIYSFVNFQSGPNSVPDDVFQVPTGLACRGRSPGQPVPMPTGTLFSRVEFLSEYNGNPVLVTAEEFYDYERELFRFDFYNRDGPNTIVHDFNQGVQFQIVQNTNKCTVSSLANVTGSFRFDVDLSSGTPHIASPNNLGFLNNNFNYSYEGVTTVRGVPADAWVSVRDSQQIPGGSANVTNAVYEVFISRPDTTLVTTHSVSPGPAILRIKLRGNFTSYVNESLVTTWRSLQYDMFDVSTKRPLYNDFDVSSCYDNDDVISIVLFFPGKLSGFNLGDLRENVREGISNYTGVSPLQVANVEIIRTNGTFIFVHVNIANMTSMATIPREDRISSDMALQTLLNSTKDPTRSFTITIPPNITITPLIHISGSGRAVPSNCDMPTDTPSTTEPSISSTTEPFTEGPTTLPPSTTQPTTSSPTTSRLAVTCPPPVNVQEQLQLKDREIIGVGIGLLFGGIIIGALITLLVFCICRCACRRGSYGINKSVKYEKHNDDIDFTS